MKMKPVYPTDETKIRNAPKCKLLKKDIDFLIRLIMDSKTYNLKKQKILNKLVIMKVQIKKKK